MIPRFPHLVELMDNPHCSLSALNRTYFVFGPLNKMLSGWTRIFDKEILPLAEVGKTLALLDVGCGGGDVAEHLLKLGKEAGISLQITAIDTDSRAIDFAKKHRSQEIQWDNIELSAVNRPFDVVVSNHVTHHISDENLPAFLGRCGRLALRKVVHNDIERSFLALLLFPVAALLPGLFSFVLYDGTVSILKSRTIQEAQELLPEGWTAKPFFPFRHLVIFEKNHAK